MKNVNINFRIKEEKRDEINKVIDSSQFENQADYFLYLHDKFKAENDPALNSLIEIIEIVSKNIERMQYEEEEGVLNKNQIQALKIFNKVYDLVANSSLMENSELNYSEPLPEMFDEGEEIPEKVYKYGARELDLNKELEKY